MQPRSAHSRRRLRSFAPAATGGILALGVAVILAATLTVSCANLPAPDQGPPIEVFVDPALGDDGNAGTDSSSPWKSLARVEAATVPPGSSVHLRAGSVFRERLVPKLGAAGMPVVYDSYGAGAKPLLLGSKAAALASDWTEIGGGMWAANGAFGLDVGVILWVEAGEVGEYAIKKYARAACAAEGDFWYDAAQDRVELRSALNPALRHPGASVELCLGAAIVRLSDRSWVEFRGLDLRYSGGYGFQGRSTSHIAIRGCDLSWIGGSQLIGSAQGVRYGNAVEFFADAADNLVEGCRIAEVYDTGLTNQCYFDSVQERIVYRNNLVRDCGYASVEVWNSGAGSTLRGIAVEGNTCAGAGEGFGGDPRQGRGNANTAGAHLRLDPSGADTGGFVVRVNIFAGARIACALVVVRGAAGSWEGWGDIDLDRNCYWNAGGQPLLRFASYSGATTSYSAATFATYKTAMSRDAASLAADPIFADAPALDYRLGASSPCDGAGTPGLLAADIDGAPRGSPPDIGAFERP